MNNNIKILIIVTFAAIATIVLLSILIIAIRKSYAKNPEQINNTENSKGGKINMNNENTNLRKDQYIQPNTDKNTNNQMIYNQDDEPEDLSMLLKSNTYESKAEYLLMTFYKNMRTNENKALKIIHPKIRFYSISNEKFIEIFEKNNLIEKNLSNERKKQEILSLIKQDIDLFYTNEINMISNFANSIKGPSAIHTPSLRKFIRDLILEKIEYPEKNLSMAEEILKYYLKKEGQLKGNIRKFIINNEDIGCCPCYIEPHSLLMEFVGEGWSKEPIELMNTFDGVDPFIIDRKGKNTLQFIIAKSRKHESHIVNIKEIEASDYQNQFLLFERILKHKEIKEHINDQGLDGQTALHIACARRDFDYIKLLIENGASLEIKNDNGQSPIDVLKLNEEERIKIVAKIITPDAITTPKSIKAIKESRDFILVVGTFEEEIFNGDSKIIEDKINNLLSERATNFNIESSTTKQNQQAQNGHA